MQSFYSDSTQVDSLPNKRNSLADFFSKNQGVIKDSRTQINAHLSKTLSDY